MEQRIAFVANLKNHLSQRNSLHSIAIPASPERQSVEEAEYQLARRQIEESAFFQGCGKHVRIRLQKWLQRLERVGSNRVWATNRNNYLKLLNLMCHCEHLTHPFLALPPQNDLPHLPKHQITQIIDEVEREVRTSRLTSRKVSINLDSAATRQKPLCTPPADHKRFKTESNTYGEEESETLVLRHWNATKTFETDFDDKTISFNLSTTDKHFFSKPTEPFDDENLNEPSLDRYQTRPLRPAHSPLSHSPHSFSHSSNKNLKEITNCETRPKRKEGFGKKSKPPLYKQIKLNEAGREEKRGSLCRQREYWESNEVTGNNSGVGTPKYLDKYQLASEKLNDSVVIVSYREGDADTCDCTSKMLGEGWL